VTFLSQYSENSSNTGISAIDRIMGPARRLFPGFVIMGICALLAMGIGLLNVFDPPYQHDRTLAFMLATAAFPCPYVVYSALTFILMHIHPSPLLARLYYSAFIPLLASPIVVGMRHFEAASELPFNRRLDAALIDNLCASVVIGVIFLVIMGIVVFGAKWAQREEFG
jgi:hypothetical protein